MTDRQRQDAAVELWQAYAADRTIENRNRLVEHYLGLARLIVSRRRKNLPLCVDPGDLTSAGDEALMWCIERFDPARGLAFTTYAAYRVNGALTDALRGMDHLGRGMKKRMLRRGEHPPRLWSLDNPRDTRKNRGRIATIADALWDARVPPPGRAAIRDDLRRWLLSWLDREERWLLLLYYYEHATMKEIGEILGKSESAISQRHTKIIAKIREWIRDHHYGQRVKEEFAAAIG